MRRLLIAAILAAGTATASDDQFLKGAELQAEVAKNCSDGCITFNREEVEVFKKEMGRLMGQAYEAGKRDEKAACRSLL